MNILFISGPNINPQDGGVARITHTLANMFYESGHNIWYLGYRKVSEDDKDRQLYFPTAKLEVSPKNLNYLENLLISKSIDVVIVQHSPCREYIEMLHKCKAKHKFRIISCFHNLILTQIYNYGYIHEYELKKKKLSLILSLLTNKLIRKLLIYIYILKYRKLYKYVVDYSDASVVLSEGQKNELLKMVGRKIDECIQVIPNCCDDIHICKTEKFNEVIWVGRVDFDIKRIDFMIEVWKKVQPKNPKWILRVLGDGPALNEVKNIIENDKVENVRFEGRVNPTVYYDRAKILCVTSAVESFSLVSIEAKMHGVVPLVQKSFPIASEIIKDKVDGILVQPFNLLDFSQELDALMKDEDLIKKYSENAIISSQQYTPNNVMHLWDTLFKSFSK